MLDIGAVEWFWLGINATALGFQLFALMQAWNRRKAIKNLNGRAREIAAAANVRREALRVIAQSLLLAIAIPGLFTANEIRLTPPLICLLAVPVVILINSMLDARDTFRLIKIADEEVASDRLKTLERIEQAITHQTEVTVAAIEHRGETVEDATDRQTEAVGEATDRQTDATVAAIDRQTDVLERQIETE